MERTAFGQRLFEARCAHEQRIGRKLSQAEIGEAVGLGQTGVHFAETKADGSPKVVHFARLYRVDPWWLASGDGQPVNQGTARNSLSDWAIRLAEMLDELPQAERPEAYFQAHLVLRPQAASKPDGTARAAADKSLPRAVTTVARGRAK